MKNLPATAGDTRDPGLIPELERALEEEMASHSRIVAWKPPWVDEPLGLQPVGSQTVKYDGAHMCACDMRQWEGRFASGYVSPEHISPS